MLNADMKFIDADIDSEISYQERIHTYEHKWNVTISGKPSNADPADLAEVLQREGRLGFRPAEQYSRPPFSTVSRLMEKEGLSTTDLGEFLRWKAKHGNMTKARTAKKGKRPVKTPPTTVLNWKKKRTAKV